MNTWALTMNTCALMVIKIFQRHKTWSKYILFSQLNNRISESISYIYKDLAGNPIGAKQCTTADVGNSRSGSKLITIADGVKCPTKVDKTNWLGSNNHGDTFSVAQDGNRVTVTRTDQNSGWGMNLKFICCPYDGNPVF